MVYCDFYLSEWFVFGFIWLGSLQLDPIESRFGWPPQLVDEDYFGSLRQGLERGARIRTM